MTNLYAELSRGLKGKCVDYTLDYLMEDFYVSHFGQLFLEDQMKAKNDGISVEENKNFDNEFIARMDNFLLFGKTADDKKVLDVILKKIKGLTAEEKEILTDWEKKAFNSIFEVIDINEKQLRLLDVIAEVEYDVYSNDEDFLLKMFSRIEKGDFMNTSIVPVKNFWFLSGIQLTYPHSMERKIFEDFVQKSYSQSAYRNNPKKLERALQRQKEIYNFFIEYYGSDEVIASGKILEQKQWEFYNAWNARLGGENNIPKEILSEELKESDSVGMIMDPVMGEYFFLDYGRFVEIFAEPDKKQKGRKKLVWGYLEDESVPKFVFERMKRKYPDGFRKVMKELLGDKLPKYFDPVNDFDILMEKYKPTEDDLYPSIQPMNERFKKYYYQKKDKVGRNDPRLCKSGKKYKKCCGR